MPRLYEIEGAFRAAVRVELNGRRTITTADFVRQLEAKNCRWDMRQANVWIETYVTTFKDVSKCEGEARTFQLFNPNGGL
jgi:hypothetical protein